MDYSPCLSAFIQPLPPTGTAFFSVFSTLLYSGQSGSRASSTSRLERRPGPGRILSGRPSGPQPLLTVIAGRGRQGPFPKRFLSRSGGNVVQIVHDGYARGGASDRHRPLFCPRVRFLSDWKLLYIFSRLFLLFSCSDAGLERRGWLPRLQPAPDWLSINARLTFKQGLFAC